MSFQPPQPPQQPPGWSGPPAGGPPPAFGAPQVPVTPTPGRAHKPRMVAPAMIVAALVVIAVAVGVVVLAGGGGGGGLDGEGAAEGFGALSDDAEYDDSGFFDLRRCPLGDLDDLNDRVADTLDLSDDVIDGDTYQYMSDRDDDFPESVWCVGDADRNDLGADNIAYTASELPDGDYERFLDDSVPSGSVEVGDPVDFKGGTIYPYCYEPADDDASGRPGCGADWVDESDDIAIGLSYTTDDGDPEPAVDALKDLLPDLVDALAEHA